MGRDWSLVLLEDREDKIVSAGFTSELSSNGNYVIPAVHKLNKDSVVEWVSWSHYGQSSNNVSNFCASNDNYGQVNGLIQKTIRHVQGSFVYYTHGNYIVITREKACGGGTIDRTAVYEIDKNTGNVVAQNTHVFANYPSCQPPCPWFTSAGLIFCKSPILPDTILQVIINPIIMGKRKEFIGRN